MAPPSKISSPAGSAPRSKKNPKTLIVTLKLAPKILGKFPEGPSVTVAAKKEKRELTSTASQTSPSESNTLPAAPSPAVSTATDSISNTPALSGADDSNAMPPPTAEMLKKPLKTAVKRSSAQADGLPKPRGKPGPKKKSKLDDGTDALGAKTGVATKLGPKANQGAINAGLRALDRSGAPCRKWQKGGFQFKTFTGSQVFLPRWQAPPKTSITGSGTPSSQGSSKENKDSNKEGSEKSNSAGDIDLASSLAPSSPAPMVAASA